MENTADVRSPPVQRVSHQAHAAHNAVRDTGDTHADGRADGSPSAMLAATAPPAVAWVLVPWVWRVRRAHRRVRMGLRRRHRPALHHDRCCHGRQCCRRKRRPCWRGSLLMAAACARKTAWECRRWAVACWLQNWRRTRKRQEVVEHREMPEVWVGT